MAQATICDHCGYQIGSRNGNYTNYGAGGAITLAPRRGLPNLAISVAVENQRGNAKTDVCETCVRQALLYAHGLEKDAVEALVPSPLGGKTLQP